VFVTGSAGVAVPELRSSALHQGQLTVRVANTGPVHTRVEEVSVRGFDAQGNTTFEATGQGWYLLAGGERGYAVPVPEQECVASTRLTFAATTTEGDELGGEVVTTAGACARPAEPQDPAQTQAR